MAVQTGDVYRFSLVGDWGAGNIAVVTHHFRALNTSAVVADISAAIKTAADAYIKPYQSNTFYWRSVNTYLVNRTPPEVSTYTTGFPLQGSRAVDSVGQQLAAIGTLRTQYAGRSYRGRMYWPAIGEDLATGQGPIAGAYNNVQAYIDNFVTAYGPSGTDPNWRWVVWSKKLGASNTIASGVARSVWGTQRRRRAGVGA